MTLTSAENYDLIMCGSTTLWTVNTIYYINQMQRSEGHDEFSVVSRKLVYKAVLYHSHESVDSLYVKAGHWVTSRTFFFLRD